MCWYFWQRRGRPLGRVPICLRHEPENVTRRRDTHRAVPRRQRIGIRRFSNRSYCLDVARCGTLVGLSAARLCFVVPIASGAHWQAIETRLFLRPTALKLPESRVRVPPFPHGMPYLSGSYALSAPGQGQCRADDLRRNALEEGYAGQLTVDFPSIANFWRPLVILFTSKDRVASIIVLS
jgi:hypothetical protein